MVWRGCGRQFAATLGSTKRDRHTRQRARRPIGRAAGPGALASLGNTPFGWLELRDGVGMVPQFQVVRDVVLA